MTPATDTRAPGGPFAADDPRTRLLGATVAVVAERGYGAADPALVAAAAGLPAPSFHRHFDDLDAAALGAYDAAVAWLEVLVAESGRQAGLAWPQRVRAVVTAALAGLAPHPELITYCAWDFPRSGPAALARQRAVVGRLAGTLNAGRTGCAWGAELPPDLERSAIGGVFCVLGQRSRRGEAARLPPLASELTYFLLVPYLDRTEALRVAALS